MLDRALARACANCSFPLSLFCLTNWLAGWLAEYLDVGVRAHAPLEAPPTLFGSVARKSRSKLINRIELLARRVSLAGSVNSAAAKLYQQIIVFCESLYEGWVSGRATSGRSNHSNNVVRSLLLATNLIGYNS